METTDVNTRNARGIRLIAVRGYFEKGLLGEEDAKNILRGPLTPDDPSTVYDDSDLLHTPGAELLLILGLDNTPEV